MESEKLRGLAEVKLIEGDVTGALKFARQYLQHRSAIAPLICYPLLEFEDAKHSPGVRETACWEDPEIATTAQLVPGVPQFPGWATPFRPPILRLLVLDRCVALAPSVLLTAAGKLLNDNIGYSNSELCHHLVDSFPGIVASDQQIILAIRHSDTLRLKQPAIYLPVDANYAAWLFGSLSRLVAFADLSELPIVLHGDPSDYHLASLAAMGIGGHRLIIYRSQVRLECRELYYCTTTFFHHAPSLSGLAYLRSRFGMEAVVPASNAAPRLYLARRKAPARPILNENDLVTLLERHGFVAVDPEEYSFDEQVRLAASADIIAGPYGANLANSMFVRRARKAFIIATKEQPEFSRLMSALAIPHWHVVPEPVKLREGRTVSESYGFTADLGQTEIVLRACLGDESM